MLYVVVGPSGAGKTSFIKLALRYSSVKIVPVDVYSPSDRKYGEGSGRNKISKCDFDNKINKGVFSVVCTYLDNMYGFTIPSDYDNPTEIYVLDYPGDYPECLDMNSYSWRGILILPPSVDVLKERLIRCNRIDRIESAELEYYECISDIENNKFNYAWTILINNEISNLYRFIIDLWGETRDI